MKKTEELRKNLKEATEYIAKVGRAQPHFRDGDKGGQLVKLEIVTEICHQESPSATNYWGNSDFDCALEAVIRERFEELAQEALVVMKSDADQSLLEEEESLRARLAEVEAVKATT
jgi:hypothetical protein